MNVFTGIMLVFAIIGFADKTFSLKAGLAESFDRGLATMATMVIPIVGVSCVGVGLIQQNEEAVLNAASVFPFDPSLLVGAILAPDLGGYFIAQQLTTDKAMLVLNGVILGSLLGQTITFQLPVFLAGIERQDHKPVLRGFITGFTVIPVGMIAAGLMLRSDIRVFLLNFVPILVLCIIIAVGIIKFPDKIIKILSVFARAVQIIINILFFVTVLGIFIPSLAYVGDETVHEAFIIVFKSSAIICGSLVFSELILKLFRKHIQKMAAKLGVNEVSVVAMLLNCATSLAILPLVSRMDEKGKMLNAAFSVSGTYVLGGQLGFVSSVSDGATVTVFVITKVLCGVLSIIIMDIAYRRSAGKQLA